MDEWVQNPTAHTALDEILPCVDNAQETLLRTRDVTHQLVKLVDNIIGNVTNRNFPPAAGLLYYNQSGPLMPPLCNPFNPNLTNRSCASGEVPLDNAAEVRHFLRFLGVNLYQVKKSLARQFLAGFLFLVLLTYLVFVSLTWPHHDMSLGAHYLKLGCENQVLLSVGTKETGLAP